MKHTSSLLILVLFIVSCKSIMNVKDGDSALQSKQYFTAISLYKKQITKTKNAKEKAAIAQKIASCYTKFSLTDSALVWYENAIKLYPTPEAKYCLAIAYKNKGNYKKSVELFTEAGIDNGTPNFYRKEILNSKQVEQWSMDSLKAYSLTKADFNTTGMDYCSGFMNNDLLLTQDKLLQNDDKQGKMYKWDGRSYSKISILKNNVVEILPLNTNENINFGAAHYNPTTEELFFCKCYNIEKNKNQTCKIYSSKLLPDQTWSEPEMLNFENDEFNYIHPCLNDDASMLYFSSDKEGGYGGYDLYYANRNKSEWSAPQLMTRPINSFSNELFPTLDKDTLYFSSDGNTNMGGLDIFKTYFLTNNNQWASITNLKSPINSEADDFNFIVDNKSIKDSQDSTIVQRGYISSNRNSTDGTDDVYAFTKRKISVDKAKIVNIQYQNILNIYINENTYVDPSNPNSKIIASLPTSSTILLYKNNQFLDSINVNDGFYNMNLADGVYKIISKKDGYLSNSADFNAHNLPKDPNQPIQNYDLTILMNKIYVGKEITLKDIYYDYDKWEIRSDATRTLDELANILKQNPNITIQMSSHTDCRGDEDYNQNLSQKRAQSAVDYLIEKGIAASRLIARGYGESSPFVNCVCNKCTEDEHQSNRRTTFTILK